jgi:hypothetical protein
MMYGVMIVPVTARLGDIGGESDGGSNRDETERADSQTARGNQVASKHELSRPIFCLDHRFVRPNYARRSRDVPCSEAG